MTTIDGRSLVVPICWSSGSNRSSEGTAGGVLPLTALDKKFTMAFSNLMWLLCGTLIPSFLLCWTAVWIVRRWAVRLAIGRSTGARKVHTSPTPMGGGLAIWFGVIACFAGGQILLWIYNAGGSLGQAVAAWVPEFARLHLDGLVHQSTRLWVLLGGGTVLMIVGLVDDRRGLRWQLRLGIQVLVATVCVVWQGWRLTAFIELPWITWALSVLWIVALINSFNMLDNMDGLSAGVAAIAAAMLAAVLLLTLDPQTRQPQIFVAGLLLVLVGSLLGFLWHNRPPARIFMGDAGSYFVGFCIAVATLLATFTEYRGVRQHAVMAPLCVMAVPLYDMITVIWIRLREGRSPFEADKNHFSHRLVDLGLTKGQAVLTIYFMTGTCGLGGLLLNRVDKFGAVIVVLDDRVHSVFDCDFGINGPAKAELVKRPLRRRTTGQAAAAATVAAPTPTPAASRTYASLVGVAVALIVAAPLIPSEAAVAFGSHVVLIMIWLVLTAAWFTRSLFDARPTWNVGIVGAALGLFLAVHSLSAVVMMHQGHGRPTLNALWLWVSFGLMFYTVRQLFRGGAQQRALVSVLIAMAVGLSVFGIYQTAYVYPRQRAEYHVDPARVLDEAGTVAPLGSPQRRHFEDRLASTEPTGPFALTNSFAGFLAPCLVLLAGLVVQVWRSLASRPRGVSAAIVAGTLLAAGAVSACLVLTKSRSGYVATLAGLGLLAVFNALPRTWLRWRWLATGGVGLAAIGLYVAFVGGLDRQVLTEAPKSLRYRFEYWQASAAMIADYPWLGCGPGNFKDYYTQYKLPGASESIADPHNFLVEVAATAGLPALALLLLVGGALWWCLQRYATERTQGSGQRSTDVRDAASIYWGVPAGFLLAYPAGWIGGQSPLLEMLWVALPITVLTLWLFRPWVVGGKLPTGPLWVAAVTLLVHLLAAGGIGFPGVAGMLWVLMALLLNTVENGRSVDAASGPTSWRGPVLSRYAIGLAMTAVCVMTVLNYLTMYRPVLAGHRFMGFLEEASARGVSADQVVRRCRSAAEADRWWGETCEMWAEVLHRQWIDGRSAERLAEFDRVATAAQERNRRSFGVAQRQGDRLLKMYSVSGRIDLLDRAAEAYSRAVQLYPNSGALHAQLAWACYLAGDTTGARREAGEALRLDQLMLHEELKLKHQLLSGLGAPRVRGAGGRAVNGGDPKQLMRDMRKLNGPQ